MEKKKSFQLEAESSHFEGHEVMLQSMEAECPDEVLPPVTDTTSRCIREVTADNQVQSRCRSLTCFNTCETHWAKRSSSKWHLWWQRTDPTPPDFCLWNLRAGQCRNVPSSAVWSSTSLEVESNLSLNVQTCAETTHTLMYGGRHSRYLINTRVVMVGKSETTGLAKCK